jgi:methylmalonyl-CoA mutase cobalamin-binding subunit
MTSKVISTTRPLQGNRNTHTIAEWTLSLIGKVAQDVPTVKAAPQSYKAIETIKAYLHQDGVDARQAIEDLVSRGGASPEEIADIFIPEIARRMGEDWCSDRMSFAEVTIGTSMLQAMLRILGREWHSDLKNVEKKGSALVLVDANEDHTLGAFVLAGRLRRLGVSAKVDVLASPESAAAKLRHTPYDVVMISTSRLEAVGPVRSLVKSLRKAVPIPPPILVGGAITASDEDITSLTGADFATSDIDEALALCGLSGRRTKAERGFIYG